MKPRFSFLLDHSIKMALSGIEVYNKPDFKAREQVFCILIVAAWEALLKAKIVKDNRNRLSALYVRSRVGAKSRYKKNRSGQYLTLDIEAASEQCGLPVPVAENLRELVAIRDGAIHLTAESASLPYLVFVLGAAALQNYAALVRKWFSRGLNEYSFYILPLGFSYPFRTMSVVDLRKEPDDVAAIARAVTAAQARPELQQDGYFFACEIKTHLSSAKKITDADLTAKIDPTAATPIVVHREVDPLGVYPYSWREVLQRVKQDVPGANANHLTDLVREHNIKGNTTYAMYNFRNRLERQRGPSKGTVVIYNDEFVRFAVDEIRKRVSIPMVASA